MNAENQNATKQLQEEEISILDLVLQIVKNAGTILKITFYFLLVGLVIAIIKPSKYTSTSIVVNEAISLEDVNLSGGLSALRKFGINLGSTGEGLTLEAYPQIISSREVLYKVVKDTFYFSDIDSTMRLTDYLNIKDFMYYLKKYTIKLPSTLFRLVFPKKALKYPLEIKKGREIFFIMDDDFSAIKTLKDEYLNVATDIETGLITISVTTADANLSADINASVLENFRKKMQEMYDLKAEEKLKFIRAQFHIAERDLRTAEEKVVRFLEKNSDPNTIALQTELERLKRNVSFKAEVYSELQTQLTQTEIELKRKEPVIRIMERPSPPIEPSGISRLFLIVASLIFGLITGLTLAMFRLFSQNLKEDKENSKKIEEIRKILPKIKREWKLPFLNKQQ